MSGKIRDEDIALVRERTSIAEVISEHVTLKPAGGGNLKGLCPFHDEKSASFNVSTARNVFYCFGCGAGGDAISFIQQIDHLSFVESIERLAAKAGIQLRYAEAGSGGGQPRQQQAGQKQRLIAAHRDAAEFYASQLGTPGARAAREFLAQRSFSREHAVEYGCGYAPDAWDTLSRHLRQKGYTSQELITAGLAKEARSGSLIDRFRRRLLWPIKDLGGDVIGFGARKLYEDDDGPKYLNTPETPLYKKSHVLYGIEHAKRDIAKQGRAVVVEGYTDVMACHLSGVPTAVATCGTAFGSDHIGVLRRLLHDLNTNGEIIFTFDGDAAGQKAALRAFADDQRFASQTFIAVGPDGMDPCELRLAKGDAAVRDLVARREPLITFALRTLTGKYDLSTPDGRIGALREAAPLVAQIKDRELRPEYARKLAGDLGMEVEPVLRAVTQAAGKAEPPRPRAAASAVSEPQRLVEREALKLALQSPVLAGPFFDAIDETPYSFPPHVALRQAITSLGGAATASGGADWVERIRDNCDDLAAKALAAELAVEPPRCDGEPDHRYVNITLARLQLPAVERRIGELKGGIQRLNPVENKDEYLRLASELFALEQQRRGLREQAVGGL
ncbi:DNA primase [Longispora albida]|uniref:DNA primase n=1 Tax=Longispora albida TaxID=203523 RepID=UPI00036E079E|nr:DNA primase [Longispora albida]